MQKFLRQLERFSQSLQSPLSYLSAAGLLLVVGAALIALGANLLVDNGTIIAQAMGVPESVIALTFVALGTSLPELVTAITSLMKGHSDLSLGNVVGANVFNLVLVTDMPLTSTRLKSLRVRPCSVSTRVWCSSCL